MYNKDHEDLDWLLSPEPRTHSRLELDLANERRRRLLGPEPDDENEIADLIRRRLQDRRVTAERLRDEDRVIVCVYDDNGEMKRSEMATFAEVCELLGIGRDEKMKVAADIKFRGAHKRLHAVAALRRELGLRADLPGFRMASKRTEGPAPDGLMVQLLLRASS